MVPLPFLARPAKTLPEIPSYIVTYRNHRAVNERYTRTPAEGMELHEQHHLEEHTGHEFHKAVIGDGSGAVLKKCVSPYFSYLCI